MKTAGLVLDFYDDVQGSVLKQAYPTPESLPEVIKEAHILSPEERDVLRDDAYALVATNEGKVLRKFACIDAGNTLLSLFYFDKVAHLLPEDARQVVGEKILERAVEFGLVEQEKVASACKGATRKRDPMQQPYVSDDADWATRTNLLSIQGQDGSKVTEAVANMKTASIDLTNHEPVIEEQRTITKTAMDGRYPLDSYADVEQAVAYFDENWMGMVPADRREYAVKTASRAAELGIGVSDTLARYGAASLASDFEAQLANRRAYSQGEAVELYNELEKSASELTPDQVCEMLVEIDKIAGVDLLYGGQVYDPYFATYGVGEAAIFKTASAEVSDEQLMSLAASDGLKGVFDFAPEFNKDPVAIFQSLPDDSKAIIADLAKTASVAGHAAEIAGLGILARPSIRKLQGKKQSEKSTHIHEAVGLGTLAAPSALSLGKSAIGALKKVKKASEDVEEGATDTDGTTPGDPVESGSPSLAKEAGDFGLTGRAAVKAGQMGVKAPKKVLTMDAIMAAKKRIAGGGSGVIK